MDKQYKLPSMEHKFSIMTKGRETGINWVGEFVYRRPTLSERGRIDAHRARLNGDLRTIDMETNYLNQALAHLRFTIRSAPAWWEASDFGGELYDGNVILDIYEQCVKFETEWRKKVLGGDAKDVEESNDPVGSA